MAHYAGSGKLEFRLLSALVLLALILAFFPAQVARADGPFYVVEGGVSTGNCDSWAAACDLQTAIGKAVSGEEIWVAAGTYKPTTDTDDRSANFHQKSGVAIYGGFAGTETARAQRNPAAHVTILSGDIDNNDTQTPIITDLNTVGGNTTNSYHVVTGPYSSTTGSLDGFTITGGYANGGGVDGYGGGIYYQYSSLVVSNDTFRGNWAFYGGGIFNDGCSPFLTNVTFNGNIAANNGGGMANYNNSSPTLSNVTFSGNSADAGGAIFDWNISNPLITNVTFYDNSATSSGGGIANTGESRPTISDTIFWGNTAASGAQVSDGDLSFPSTLKDSIVQDDCPTGSTCTNIITADPLLGPLGDYGGNTQTIPLLVGSSAINAGNDVTCAKTDQRNFDRPQGAHCDIGSFESRGFTMAVHGGNLQSTPINTAFPSLLSVTISSAYAEPFNGGKVTFTAPGSGASATITGSPAVINSGGIASILTLIANGNPGSYTVSTSAAGVVSPVTFDLTNAKNNATVNLGGLSQVYNGAARAASATTIPSGLVVIFSYTGADGTTYGPTPTAPVNAGHYTVTAVAEDANYAGSASGTLVIAKAGATITLGSLSQTYNGKPKTATAVTSPAGLAAILTYTGVAGTDYPTSATPPVAAGKYTVSASIDDPNYAGTASANLVVNYAIFIPMVVQ
jgi:hypothetical protein